MRANPASLISTRLVLRTRVAVDVVDLRFELIEPSRLAFRGGQSMTLKMLTGSQETFLRSYSIASAPDGDGHVRFIVRIVPGGAASTFLLRLPIGSIVEMVGPEGALRLDPHHQGDVVFAATGTAIAPVLSMLAELRHRAEPGRRLVHWGLRREPDIFLLHEVEELCACARATLAIHLSRPSDAWNGFRGRLTADLVEEARALDDPLFYLVGCREMVRDVRSGLIGAGVDRLRQIRTDAASDLPAAASASATTEKDPGCVEN